MNLLVFQLSIVSFSKAAFCTHLPEYDGDALITDSCAAYVDQT